MIRPSAIGDIIMASPMLPRLRRTFPQARLYWMAEPAMVPLLRQHPDLDEVICWPKREWTRLIKTGHLGALAREIKAFRATLTVKKPDLVLDVQGLLRSRFLAWLTGAPLRVGFRSKEPHLGLMTHVIDKGPSTKRIGSEYHYILDVLGAAPLQPGWTFPIAENTMQSVRALLQTEGIEGPYAVLAPFTTRPQKHWLEDRWARVADVLQKEFALKPILLGAAQDRHAAQRIRSHSSGHLHVLCGRTNLLESFAIVTQASLTIGVDTGLTHMAMVQNRPAIALFGATCPYLHTGSNHAVVLYQRMPCSPCRRRPTCGQTFPCMAAISEDDVLNAAHRLLDISKE